MKIYFAAPLFSDAEREYNSTVCRQLEEEDYDVFLPQRDGIESRDVVFEQEGIDTHEDLMNEIFEIDRSALLDSDVIVAVLDGLATDEGVAVEMGIAYENDIPIIGFDTDLRVFAEDEPHNAMVFGLLTRLVESPTELMEALADISPE